MSHEGAVEATEISPVPNVPHVPAQLRRVANVYQLQCNVDRSGESVEQ